MVWWCRRGTAKGLYDNVDECAWYVVHTLILMDCAHQHQIFSDDDHNPVFPKELKVNSACYSVLALINGSSLSNKQRCSTWNIHLPMQGRQTLFPSMRVGILCIIPRTNHRMASLAYDHCFLVSCGPLGTRTSSRNLSFTFGGRHFHSSWFIHSVSIFRQSHWC